MINQQDFKDYMINCPTREGDRFHYKLHDSTLEMILVDGVEGVKVIQLDKKGSWEYIGQISSPYSWTKRDSNPNWEYLGNFNKSDGFKRLYDKLSM